MSADVTAELIEMCREMHHDLLIELVRYGVLTREDLRNLAASRLCNADVKKEFDEISV